MSNEDQEIWKTYPKIPFVEASNLGRIRTKDRVVKGKDGKKYHIKGQVLKQCLHKKGYLFVHFQMNGKTVDLLVHRIVATCFVPNPDNLPEVNHIDNNRANNCASNLEWCTREYNEDYKKNFGTSAAEVLGRALGHPVIAVNLDTFEVFWFESQSEASRQLGIDVSSISKVVKGRQNKAMGFWFCDADEDAIENTRAKFSDEIAEDVKKLMNENHN